MLGSWASTLQCLFPLRVPNTSVSTFKFSTVLIFKPQDWNKSNFQTVLRLCPPYNVVSNIVTVFTLNAVFGLMYAFAVARKLKVDLNWPNIASWGFYLWKTLFVGFILGFCCNSWNLRELGAYIFTPGGPMTCNKNGRTFKSGLEVGKMWGRHESVSGEVEKKSYFYVAIPCINNIKVFDIMLLWEKCVWATYDLIILC